MEGREQCSSRYMYCKSMPGVDCHPSIRFIFLTFWDKLKNIDVVLRLLSGE